MTDTPSVCCGEEQTAQSENLEEQKARIDSLWTPYKEEVKDNSELMDLFDRQKSAQPTDRDPHLVLQEHNYPNRTDVNGLALEKWQELDSKFCQDGFVYLLRGDHPGLTEKGIYSFTYGYGKLTTEGIAHQLHSSKEAGYLLYNNEVYLTRAPLFLLILRKN